MRVAVNSHALPVYKKSRIASLLCIFETTVVPRPLSNDPRFTQCIYRYSRASKRFVEVYYNTDFLNKNNRLQSLSADDTDLKWSWFSKRIILSFVV